MAGRKHRDRQGRGRNKILVTSFGAAAYASNLSPTLWKHMLIRDSGKEGKD